MNCSAAKQLVKEYVDDIIAGKNPNFYAVEKAVETAFDQFIPGKNFTFGNCQKLINMTVKYFYIVTYSCLSIRSNFNNCHCPMDNVMIECVISELDKANVTLDDINNKNKLNIVIPQKKKISKGYLRNSWSNITQQNHKQYDLFQAAVKYLAQQRGVSPIEYDYLNGIYTKEEMIEKIKLETRRYAKRQLTWFRKNKQTILLDGTNDIQNNVNIILEGIN